jgi:predicted RNA binding protein YcfA (HicA-like mRNA interferase family)
MAGLETTRTKVVARMERDGWLLVRHGKEHDIYRHASRTEVIAVPRHRTLSRGVARSIAKAAGWM